MRVLVTTTLSPNQVRAHLAPILAMSVVDQVLLVTDEAPPSLPKLIGAVPGRRKRLLLGRAGSKLVDSSLLARRFRPTWILSYNIMPHAVNALVAGRVAGAKTMYHMIGGDTEWIGGGWGSENAVLGRLRRPSRMIESGLLEVMRHTDVIGTMGTRARRRLLLEGLDPCRVALTPPAIDIERFKPIPETPQYDLITAGRLVEAKRLQDFIAVVEQLRLNHPTLRAAIAGAGPLEQQLRADAARRGLSDAIDFLGSRDDIENVYRSGRIFVLTSGFEGLSVALGEALACGLPAIVTDVGDLRDLVDGRNGSVVPVGDVQGLAQAAARLLQDDVAYERASRAARTTAASRSVSELTAVYEGILNGPGVTGTAAYCE